MKKYIHSKIVLFTLLSMTTLFYIYPSLMALTSTQATQHNRIITQYIQEIRRLQNQVFSLSEEIVNEPSEDTSALDSRLNLIYSQLEALDNNIATYLDTLPKLSEERRDTLILLDALYFLENSFYQLVEFITEQDFGTKMLLLEDFYFLRSSATQALNRLESILNRP